MWRGAARRGALCSVRSNLNLLVRVCLSCSTGLSSQAPETIRQKCIHPSCAPSLISVGFAAAVGTHQTAFGLRLDSVVFFFCRCVSFVVVLFLFFLLLLACPSTQLNCTALHSTLLNPQEEFRRIELLELKDVSSRAYCQCCSAIAGVQPTTLRLPAAASAPGSTQRWSRHASSQHACQRSAIVLLLEMVLGTIRAQLSCVLHSPTPCTPTNP